MFDIGLSELGLIGVVALVVIGPKRLPTVARTVGTLLGRAQRYIRDVKDEVNQQVEFEALKNTVQSVESEVKGAGDAMRDQWSSINDDLHLLSPVPSWDEVLSKTQLQERTRRFHRRAAQTQGRTPLWFKQQQGVRRNLQSGSARMVRYRRNSAPRRPSFFA